MWATEAEAHQQWIDSTLPVSRGYDWRIRDIFDSEEFITGATLDLLHDGQVVETHEFVGSSEFADNDGPAWVQATSFAAAWVESKEFTLEERLGPYGIEWEREQYERHYGEAA
jgi:hypothetical protein